MPYFVCTKLVAENIEIMSLEYGKEIAEQTLNYLSGAEDPLFRLMKSWSEIDLIGTGDVNPEIYHQIKSWKERYLKANLPDSRTGMKVN